jgi:hypothetical protein
MKYLITEKQLKQIRKYMKNFIKENDMDSYIQGDNDPNAPWNKSYGFNEDDDIRIVNVTYNGKKIAKITIDFDNNEVYTDFYTNNQSINNSIDDKLDELKAEGMGVLEILADNDTITYQELMSEN